MSLRDFNIYNGDITIVDGIVETDNIFDAEISITNRLKTLLYKTFYYDSVFQNNFKGTRIIDSFETESLIVDFCFNEIKRRYGDEYISFFIKIECLIIENIAYLYFYREDQSNQKILLLDYELTL